MNVFRPLTAHHSHFIPSKAFLCRERQYEMYGTDARSLYALPANCAQRFDPTDTNSTAVRSATPSYNDTSSKEPPWDPSSRSPGHDSSNLNWARDNWPDETVSTSSARSSFKVAAHPVTDALCNSWRYDLRLHGKCLRVAVDGIKILQDVVITGNGHICSVGKKKRIVYEPAKVSLKHPVMKEYARWIVIRGEHTGKFVRHVRNMHKSNDLALLMSNTRVPPSGFCVARVETVPNSLDSITGEQFDITYRLLVKILCLKVFIENS